MTDFLERVEELRLSRGVSRDHLLLSIPELLTHDALFWYRTNRFRSWKEFKEKLIAAFLPYDYENSLWEEIRRRTQGARERVITYVTAMESLFRKSKELPSESMRLSIIRRNVLPHIHTQLALQSIQSVSQLVTCTRAVEEASVRVQQFCPPPTNYRQLLEPELAYRTRPLSVAVVDTDISPGQTLAVVQPGSGSQASAYPIAAAASAHPDHQGPMCWNCRPRGHVFRNCQEPRKIFCYRCGKENVTSVGCPTCPKNAFRSRQ